MLSYELLTAIDNMIALVKWELPDDYVLGKERHDAFIKAMEDLEKASKEHD